MIAAFYDQLAPYYQFVYPDWEASVTRQATALDGIIREFFGSTARYILDAACGIGTQSIGLAALGYVITASDISPVAVERARDLAQRRSLTIDFRIADMRTLRSVIPETFDVVIACDNAVPHLLTDSEILRAFRQFYDGTTPPGGCIISVRDYANLERGGRQLHPRLIHDTPTGRLFTFDVWDFDGDYYDLTIYAVEDRGQAEAVTHVARGGRYYCVTIDKLEQLLKEAGFQQVTTLRDCFFQPVIVGRK
ncbi:MAG TPA: methyltransferase domain-containing protein [Anaerolineae bacterium]|nr:methyltransferase domain-containing protein [Anaerolineae bacterium]